MESRGSGGLGAVSHAVTVAPCSSSVQAKSVQKSGFSDARSGRRQVAKGYGPRSYGARQPVSPWNRTIRNPQSRSRVVTVRLVVADADRLPLVGPTRSETSCAGGGVKASQAARCTVTVSHPAKPCRGEVPIWLSPPDCHDRGFSPGRAAFRFCCPFRPRFRCTSLGAWVLLAARTARRHVVIHRRDRPLLVNYFNLLVNYL